MITKFIRIEFFDINNQFVCAHILEGCGFLVASEYANRITREFHLCLRAEFVLP